MSFYYKKLSDIGLAEQPYGSEPEALIEFRFA